ncbi:hypothetical protein [Microbulbifer hydrolyticus]|uniref:hypothetical protein n=1 Tax=Microbulbifer hydrolyticus TaxID=48074 RepID=UPI001F1DAF8A|nr:hypothetical protein [Microbulbifer hydrolyticus]
MMTIVAGSIPAGFSICAVKKTAQPASAKHSLSARQQASNQKSKKPYPENKSERQAISGWILAAR